MEKYVLVVPVQFRCISRYLLTEFAIAQTHVEGLLQAYFLDRIYKDPKSAEKLSFPLEF